MRDRNKPDSHLITTTHPYFIELGLGSFTIVNLVNWWNQKSGDGRFLNRRHLNTTNANDLYKLLGLSVNTEFYWYGWKPNLTIPNAGVFKKQNLKYFLGNTGGSDDDRWEYRGAGVYDATRLNNFGIYTAGNPIIGSVYNGETYQDIFLPPYDNYFSPLNVVEFQALYGLIQLNKWINLFDDYFPRGTWNKADPPLGYNFEALAASWALLNEIRAAKGGPYVEWSGDVTFNVSEGGVLNCPITETITFKLQLTDETTVKSENKQIALKNMSYVGPQRDAIGGIGAADGETADINSDPARQTGGEIALQWNPISKQYQSGNVNMLAKLATDLGPGKAPSLNFLLSNNIAETLADPSNKNSYIPARGSGMPIRTQNSMPLQWSPNYAQPENVRCNTNNTDKQMIPLYNFNPRKAYPAGQEVLITLIDDMWHVSDLGEGNLAPEGSVPTGIGKWGPFSYLMTSSQFFFKGEERRTGKIKNITPRSAELNFHKLFYGLLSDDDRQLNFDDGFYGPSGNEALGIYPIGGYNFSQPFNTNGHEVWYDFPGWLQITSFDFLDSQIYGIRSKGGSLGANPDKCSLSSTSATRNAAGQIIPFNSVEYASRNSAHTGTFFGCVFPEGYQGTQDYDNRNGKWNVFSGSIWADPSEYLNTINSNATKNPFENNPERSTSNVKCLSTSDPGQLYEPINLERNNWKRGNDGVPIKDASMFYLTDDRRTIPADVMLNASPKGKYGSPIKPLSCYNQIYQASFDFIKDGYIAKALECGVWLRKQPTDPTIPYSVYDSAFDFELVKVDNIMFRPLKLEAYLQIGAPHNPSLASNLSREDYGDYFKYFQQEAARTQTDYTNPISHYVVNREYDNCFHNFAGHPKPGFSNIRYLKWGAWTTNKPTYTALHRWRYWGTDAPRFDAMYWTKKEVAELNFDNQSNWIGAGAFGVITTSQKVTANTKIEFQTKNLYGMSAAANGKFTLAGHQYQDKTWGVGNFVDSYKQENILDLSVRIYHGHPDYLTLYDPRYFAVHHFNPGVAFLNDKYYATGTILTNNIGNFKRNGLIKDFTNFRNCEGDLLSHVYYCYPQQSGVDIQVPSRYEKHIDFSVDPDNSDSCHKEYNSQSQSPIYKPQELDIKYLVFSNGTQEFNERSRRVGGKLKPPLMPKEYWIVDTKRTGKLLPYRYKKLTLSAPITFGRPVDMVSENDENVKGKPVLEHSHELIVKNRGKNYKIGDGIGILDYSLFLKVEGIDPNTKGITSLSVVDFGAEIPLNFASATGDKIGSFVPSFKMQTLTGAGEGFDAYFVSLGVNEIIACDPKPYLIKRDKTTEISRIAANEPGPKHLTTGQTGAAEAGSYIETTETTAYIIPPGLKSKDGSYDIFFHFHNDISMTWLACGNGSNPAGDENNATECTEQYVSIEKINLI